MAEQNEQQPYDRLRDLMLQRLMNKGDGPENRQKDREQYGGAYDDLGDPKADPRDIELPNRSGKIDPTLKRRNYARQQTLIDILMSKVQTGSGRRGKPDWIDYPDPDK